MPFVTDTNLSHFTPTLLWPNQYQDLYLYTYEQDGNKYSERTPMWRLVDPTTGLYFLSDPRYIIRLKFFYLALIGVPLMHIILTTFQTIVNLIRLIFDFGKMIYDGKKNFAENFSKFLNDILRLLFTPLICVALEITAIFGLLFPLNARKIYGSTERAMTNTLEVYSFYNKQFMKNMVKNSEGNKGISAPCFQPKFIQSNEQ